MKKLFTKIKDVDELYIFRSLKDKPVSLIAFIGSFIIGILANGFAMANGYMNGDGVAYGSYYKSGGWDISQGRWGLIFFSDRFVTSWFDGLIACFLLAVAAVLIVKIFKIKSVSIIVSISMLIATQTHFAQWQGSVYVLFPYAAAFLSAVACMYFCEKEGNIYCLLAVITLVFSVSIYQAYVTIVMVLFLIKIVGFFIHEKPYRYIRRRILSYFFVGVLSGCIYYIGVQVSLWHYNVQMTGGRGWASPMSGHLPIFFDTANTIKSTYKIFFQLLLIDGITLYSKVHKLVYIFLFVTIIYLVILNVKREKKISNKIITVILLIFFPISVVLLRLITETVIPWSMFPAKIFVPIGMLIFYEDTIKTDFIVRDNSPMIRFIGVGGWGRYGVILGCLFLALESIYINNVDYSNLKKRNEKTFAASIRLLDTVEYAKGYEKGMPVIFIGNLGSTYENPLREYEETLEGYEAYIMDYLPFHGTGSHGWHTFIRNNLGVVLSMPSDYSILYNEIENSDWINTLSIFPDKNCTGIYDGVLVVRIGN